MVSDRFTYGSPSPSGRWFAAKAAGSCSWSWLSMLDETGYVPEWQCAPGEEIRRHAVRIAEKFDLYADALFSTTVTSLNWDETSGAWAVRVEREPAAGPELHCADAAFGALVQDDRPDPARRAQIARVPGQGLPVVGTPVRLHAITHSPSTSTHWPVTNEASGPVRKATTEASSSGRPRRFSAWWSSTCRRYAFGSSWISSAAVGKAPGETQLTRIPAGPSSPARARARTRHDHVRWLMSSAAQRLPAPAQRTAQHPRRLDGPRDRRRRLLPAHHRHVRAGVGAAPARRVHRLPGRLLGRGTRRARRGDRPP